MIGIILQSVDDAGSDTTLDERSGHRGRPTGADAQYGNLSDSGCLFSINRAWEICCDDVFDICSLCTEISPQVLIRNHLYYLPE